MSPNLRSVVAQVSRRGRSVLSRRNFSSDSTWRSIKFSSSDRRVSMYSFAIVVSIAGGNGSEGKWCYLRMLWCINPTCYNNSDRRVSICDSSFSNVASSGGWEGAISHIIAVTVVGASFYAGYVEIIPML